MLVLRRDIYLFGIITLPGFAACGDDGRGTTPAPRTSFALPDVTQVAADRIGRRKVIPADSNIIPTDFNDSSLASLNGAVHLSISLTQTLIGRIFGYEAGRVGLIPQYTGLNQKY